jgi:hypothetical protein
MDSVNHYRPHRAIIRCKAKMKLLKLAEDDFDWAEPVAGTLLEEIAATLFQSHRWQAFYQQRCSKQKAKEAEDRLAHELAETYLTISKRRQDPVVQGFNALL